MIVFSLTFSLFSEETSTSTERQKTSYEVRDELRWLQAEAMVTIATKYELPISRAPGIITVITAEKIKHMGFRTLTDILKTVPGFDISMNNNGIKEIGVRGVLNSLNVKILIDGHSVNEPSSGEATWNFHDLVVENIKKIEIIRGPGSAIYGQNAFLAVVNVITKDTDDIDGFQFTVSGGSYDTQNYNMLFGKEFGDLKISGFLDYYDTEGFSKTIEQDIIFGHPASLSPGRSQNRKEKTDLNIKLSYKNLEIKGKYMKKRKEGYIGFHDALSDDTMFKDTYIFGELNYKLFFGDKLSMIPKVYYDQYNIGTNFYETRPDGFYSEPFPGFIVNFPDGIKGTSGSKLRTIGFENQLNYNVFEGNKLTFGFQYEWIHQHDISYHANANPLERTPLTSFTDFSKDLPFTSKKTRHIWALFLQDEWNINKDIDLTVGVRYDRFSRFGSTTNPRVGVIWRFIEDAHLKLLFATAFRAPNFDELFTINNPVYVGNPNLDPEKINTFEIGLGYNFTKHISANINYFFNRIRDRIVLVENSGIDRPENSAGARIKGLETELKADLGHDNYLYANYTFQKAEETRGRERLPFTPEHKANFGLNVGFWKYANANLNTFVSGPRPREDGDIRGNLPSYALVNLTLIGRNFIDNFEIRGSVFNLSDKSYDDPAPKDTVSTDYPQQGRSFMFELRYEF
ncbi:Colicin I receptor precursor [Candidatus Brocadiaceae bacterium S225]|uniref:TonB-dependent receptor n=1 Tax=Candidatus Scalindua brodae TaxID=237368 RepID=A0A0B0ELW6_9BACT|nr:MAG: TonB-dependent receptor [Candidatus Scalindua brodae]TWU30775.1 Colicin I receptor precursor [Candidatus Brocadiaceae bacterium S225]